MTPRRSPALAGQLVGVVEPDDVLRLGGVQRRVAVDLRDVGVGHHVPEALGVGQLVPGHRLLGAQPAEHLVVLTALEAIKVGQVDARCLHVCPPSSAALFVAILEGYPRAEAKSDRASDRVLHKFVVSGP